MTDLISLSLHARRTTVEEMVLHVVQELQTRYDVPISTLAVKWENRPRLSLNVVEEIDIMAGTIRLDEFQTVSLPHEKALRDTPVSLELAFQDGEKIKFCFSLGKILDIFGSPSPLNKSRKETGLQLLSDDEIKSEITKSIIAAVISARESPLNDDSSYARFLRNGIIKAYGFILQGSEPNTVSQSVWFSTDDPEFQKWIELHGCASLLYETLKSFYTFQEIMSIFESTEPPMDQPLHEFVQSVLERQ